MGTSAFLVELDVLDEMEAEVATRKQVHDEVKVFTILKSDHCID